MKRILKGFGLLFLLATVAATLLSVGCAPPEDPDQPQSPTPTRKILFLGDSIAEAILGASPLSERESYGYYGVVGIVNNFWYVNRSISGHQTKQLLDYIRQGDDGAMLTDTHIRTADIIHISILGNDLLQNNLGEIMYNELIGETEITDLILAKAAENFAAIVTVLREKNPDAVLIFQSVYNPIHPDSVLVNARVRKLLADRGIAPDQYRTQCQPTLDKLNDIPRSYLEDHPDAFIYLDVCAEFNRIYDADPDRGIRLIYSDDIHPSNEGHAVIADLITDQMIRLGFTDAADALTAYRNHRIRQAHRLFPSLAQAIETELNAAPDRQTVTERYFDLTEGHLPSYLPA